MNDQEGKVTRTEIRLAKMDSLLKEIKDQLTSINKKINAIDDKVTQQGNHIITLENSMQELILMKKEINVLKADNQYLKNKIRALEDQSENAQIAEKRNFIEISNLPKIDGKSVKEEFMALVRLTKVEISESDIAECYRQKERVGKDSIVTVKFTQAEKRDKAMREMKKVKPNYGMMNLDPGNRKIYINEALIPTRKFLLYKVKQEGKSKNWRYIWTYAGSIYIKIEKDGNNIKINSIEDLELLLR